MAEYTLKYINHRAKTDAEAFIMDCEARYREQIETAAREVATNSSNKPIVLLNGPSSSGKTTTADRLRRMLEQHGIHAVTLSMDDYYRTNGSYEAPFDTENNVPDWESPECMNLPLLSQHLAQLATGEEIAVPSFDFSTRTFRPNQRVMRLHPGEVALIEGIHAFNPVIMGDLAHTATGIYLSVASSIVPEEGNRMEDYMIRFLRRAQRDRLFRSSPVSETLTQWKSVRRGERLYISPHSGQANIMIDTFLPYELCVLMEQLAPELRQYQDWLTQVDLEPVNAFREWVEPIDYAPFIPPDSVLHEFIG